MPAALLRSVSRGQASKLLTPERVVGQFGHSALWVLVEVISLNKTKPSVFHGLHTA